MIKIAIIGCGRIFHKHFLAINNTKGLKVISVCDIDKKKFTSIPSKIKCFTNINKLFLESDVDLVVICSPSGLHSEHALLALKYNKHVLLEKPIDVSYLKALNLVNKFKTRKRKLFVVKQNRFNKTIVFLKKIIEENRLGKINLVISNVLWSRPQKYYDQSSWRGTKKLDGGVILNQSSHYIDLLLWLFGDIKEYNIIRKKLSRNIQTEDTALLSIFFKNNILANVTMTTLIPLKNYEGSITVIGEKGLIKVGGQALNEIVNTINVKYPKNINYKINDVYGFGHKKIYEEIVKEFKGITNKAIFANEGLNSLKFINDMYRRYKI